ncbi:uncharacterized protein RMCB_5179 [Mycolicibacterium brisbanense]|uniref:Uncharacterized protein n=1 Tax=Mycolicibacterium brisbanense TaxID=146020 RepID=A0A124E0N2_9MYCO|nr:uncharacterized protein RMCB_5179 [Mycolicibacterium brisbanense]
MTTFFEKKLFAALISWLMIAERVSGPNSGAMYAKLPSTPNNSGGNDSAHQKAAWADSEKMESSQLLESVRRVMCQM